MNQQPNEKRLIRVTFDGLAIKYNIKIPPPYEKSIDDLKAELAVRYTKLKKPFEADDVDLYDSENFMMFGEDMVVDILERNDLVIVKRKEVPEEEVVQPVEPGLDEAAVIALPDEPYARRAQALGIELVANQMLAGLDFAEGVECAVGSRRGEKPHWRHGSVEEALDDSTVQEILQCVRDAPPLTLS